MQLTSTAACVLGLLQMGPAPGQPGFQEASAMTGGQLFAAAERSVSRFWNLTRSQVYAALPRLESAGLVEVVGEPGPRGALHYRTTPAGRREFASWIEDFVSSGPRDDQLRSPVMLSVFFGHFVEADRLRPLLEEYAARHRRSLAVAEDMLAALGTDTSLPASALSRRAAYDQMMVDWLGLVRDRVH